MLCIPFSCSSVQTQSFADDFFSVHCTLFTVMNRFQSVAIFRRSTSRTDQHLFIIDIFFQLNWSSLSLIVLYVLCAFMVIHTVLSNVCYSNSVMWNKYIQSISNASYLLGVKNFCDVLIIGRVFNLSFFFLIIFKFVVLYYFLSCVQLLFSLTYVIYLY